MENTVIEEVIENVSPIYISNVITNGIYKRKLEEQMQDSWSVESLNSVFLNSINALTKFVNPYSSVEKMTKLLCLGKVQSGKTAFFISTIALAFDNGYDIAYVIGGTKNNLLSQNRDRILSEFENNDDILIMDINNADTRKIRQQINSGCKVILMVLKHKASTSETNLSNLEKLTSSLNDVPSLIVDDEGDEYSPGAKNRKLTISQSILTCVNYIKRGTYLIVTATPQSNLLLSTTLNNLSPDSCVLVEPGIGYTGAAVFHDSIDNPLVVTANDTDDFVLGVPKSFRDAIKFFLIGAAIRILRGDSGQHNMLVHPSAKTDIQNLVYSKVKDELQNIMSVISEPHTFGYDDLLNEFMFVYNDMKENIKLYCPSFEEIIPQIVKNLNRTEVFQINTRESSDRDIDKGIDKFCKYKIFVGGNMLERGITIKNLSVTYIYRTAKQVPLDNALQRARWFGYKKDYLDLCRVYMTSEMKEYFIDINNHEQYLWKTVKEFLKTGEPLQKMERIFQLDNPVLILTRKSISKTIRISSLNIGYSYSKSINYANKNDYQSNCNLLSNFISKLRCKPEEYNYGGSRKIHTHRIYRNVSFCEFYKNVINNFIFPDDSLINRFVFKTLYDAVENNLIKDQFTLIQMRYGENQFRSTIANGIAIKELPESYQVTNDYPGDKAICNDEFNIQIHNVYVDQKSPDDIIPFLTVNYPYDEIRTKYVTGENE